MQPILLKGHTRPLSRVRFNREGDLLFTAGVDGHVCVWYSSDGERLGTYNGHEGAVWDTDVSFNTERLVTGSADRSVRLWDVQQGTTLCSFAYESMVRAVSFSSSDKLVFGIQDKSFGKQTKIHIHDITRPESVPEGARAEDHAVMTLTVPDLPKTTAAVWGPLDRTIVTGSADGAMREWDVETGKLLRTIKAHKKEIKDLQYNSDRTLIISASSDMTSALFDARNLKEKKRYLSDRPLNSAAVSPLKNHIIVGGGQEARDVTTTGAGAGHFEIDFYHSVYVEQLGSVKGHFSPVNSLAFSPTGKCFASGAEEGYVRLHHFDERYLASNLW